MYIQIFHGNQRWELTFWCKSTLIINQHIIRAKRFLSVCLPSAGRAGSFTVCAVHHREKRTERGAAGCTEMCLSGGNGGCSRRTASTHYLKRIEYGRRRQSHLLHLAGWLEMMKAGVNPAGGFGVILSRRLAGASEDRNVFRQ